MDEHNELCTRLRAVGMELFRRDGLRFTMQQAAAMMHISKKTIYAVYPSQGGAAAGYGGRCVHKDPCPQAAHP